MSNFKDTPGFKVTSPCGRVWFVPFSCVASDYAGYLQQADKLTAAEALLKATENEDFIETWFYEQFSWSDIDHYGVLVKEATASAIKSALDFYRNNSDSNPSNNCEGLLLPKSL